jgi:ferritin
MQLTNKEKQTMAELMNFIHPDNLTTELAVIDNIAHELNALNETMKNICEALQLIAIKK